MFNFNPSSQILLVWCQLHDYYTLRECQTATNGLCEENVIGEGGYGIVHFGVLPGGTKIAVKNLLNNKYVALDIFSIFWD